MTDDSRQQVLGIEHSDSAGRWQEKREIRDQKSEVRGQNFEFRN
jgi:hypothetical protein